MFTKHLDVVRWSVRRTKRLIASISAPKRLAPGMDEPSGLSIDTFGRGRMVFLGLVALELWHFELLGFVSESGTAALQRDGLRVPGLVLWSEVSPRFYLHPSHCMGQLKAPTTVAHTEQHHLMGF